jgi:filamentous hemagglutinin
VPYSVAKTAVKVEKTAGLEASKAVNIPTTTPVEVSGKRPIDAGKSYEKAVVDDIYSEFHAENPKYATIVDGKMVKGVADKVFKVDGQTFAVEAKYVDSWSDSLRNPLGKSGDKPWGLVEQRKMINQARKYSSAFDETLYHTNSRELVDHYTKVFNDAGIKDIKFNITPVIKK